MLLHVNQVRHMATNIPQHCHHLKGVGSAAQACKCRLPGKVEHRQIGGRWYMQLHRYLSVAVPLLGGKVCKASICGDNTAHSWGCLQLHRYLFHPLEPWGSRAGKVVV